MQWEAGRGVHSCGLLSGCSITRLIAAPGRLLVVVLLLLLLLLLEEQHLSGACQPRRRQRWLLRCRRRRPRLLLCCGQEHPPRVLRHQAVAARWQAAGPLGIHKVKQKLQQEGQGRAGGGAARPA